MPKILKLRKPIMAHGEEVSELTFRDGTTADIINNGLPITFYVTENDDMQEAKINMSVITKMIVDLAGIPKSSVKEMDKEDFIEAVGIVTSFFGQTP